MLDHGTFGTLSRRWYEDGLARSRLAIYADEAAMRREVEVAAQYGWTVASVDPDPAQQARPARLLRTVLRVLGMSERGMKIAVTYGRSPNDSPREALPEIDLSDDEHLRAIEQLLFGGYLTPEEFEAESAVLRSSMAAPQPRPEPN